MLWSIRRWFSAARFSLERNVDCTEDVRVQLSLGIKRFCWGSVHFFVGEIEPTTISENNGVLGDVHFLS